MKRVSLVALALGLVMVPPGLAAAQETPKPTEGAKTPEAARPARPRGPQTLLRVQIVLARHQGEKKVSSVPYSLLVTSDERRVRLRMGVEVPIALTSGRSESGGAALPPMTNYQYKNVGTNIDCSAEDRGDGLFKLSLDVENSSVYASSPGQAPGVSAELPMVGDRPMFRTFNVSLNPVLRDGQSLQTVASTDPVTGEVVKIDVTLNVVK